MLCSWCSGVALNVIRVCSDCWAQLERAPVLHLLAAALHLGETVVLETHNAADRKGRAGAQVGLGEAERKAVLRIVAPALHLVSLVPHFLQTLR